MNYGGIRLFYRVRSMHSNHIRIAYGMVSVGLFLIAAKIVGAVKEMVVAYYYGVSGVVDSYVLALTLVTWLPQIIWSVSTAILVPMLVALHKKPKEERIFLQEINGIAIQLGLIVAILILVLGNGLIPLMVGKWDTESADLAQRFTRQMAPVGFMMVLSASLSIRLQARENQIYTFLEAMLPLGVLLFLLFSQDGFSGTSLIHGTLVGAAAQLGLLIWIAGRNHSVGGGIAWRPRSAWWKQKIYINLGIMAVGQAAISLSHLVDNAFAAQLGEGAVATLGYANRIVALLSGLAATTTARAVLPVLSHTVAEGKWRLGRIQSLQWAGLIFLATGSTVFLAQFLSPSVVALLFQRGAFTANDTAAVARVLQFGLLQLPFYCSGIVLVQWFAATGRYRLLAGLGGLGIIMKVVLNAAFTPILGVAGIALSTGGMYFVNMAILLLVILRERGT